MSKRKRMTSDERRRLLIGQLQDERSRCFHEMWALKMRISDIDHMIYRLMNVEKG